MDYSLVKKNPQTDSIPQTSFSKDNTPRGSPLRILSYRNTPSPDNTQLKQKGQQSSWHKLYPEQQGGSGQYTPPGISRSRLLSARTP